MRKATLAVVTAIAECLISNPKPLFAQKSQLTIEPLATIDYPGSGNSTTVQGINDLGDVTGYFEDSTGIIRSFIRYAEGTFSEPIVEPNDVGNLTVAKDIDNTGRICGYYFSSEAFHPYRGFFLSGTTFTEYGAGFSDYYLTGITDAGDFCGTIGFDPGLSEGLLVLADGRSVVFTIASHAEANAINLHTGIVGDYIGGEGGVHGYIRDTVFPAARLYYPVDYPGAVETYLLALNDGGRLIVGKYVGPLGTTHGLILQRPDTFTSFDYPHARETSLNGINNHKVVSGSYADSGGVRHGFIGKIHESP